MKKTLLLLLVFNFLFINACFGSKSPSEKKDELEDVEEVDKEGEDEKEGEEGKKNQENEEEKQEDECDDGQDCTNSILDNKGQCQHILISGNCLIDGVCYKNKDENPENSCEICSIAEDTEKWTGKAIGSECGYCKECGPGNECVANSTCCNIQDWEENNTNLGKFIKEELWVNNGCSADYRVANKKETFTSHYRYDLECNDGQWSFAYAASTGGPSSSNRETILSIIWNDDCDEHVEDFSETYADICDTSELPFLIRTGYCGTTHPTHYFPDGGIIGIRKCLPGEEDCTELSVECSNKQWINFIEKSAPVPPTVGNPYIDSWFEIIDDIESIVDEQICTDITCSALELKWYYAHCDHFPSELASVNVGDVFGLNTLFRTPSSSSGNTTKWTCQEEGIWSGFTDSGSGTAANNDGYFWENRWSINSSVVHVAECSNSCFTSASANHIYKHEASDLAGISVEVPYRNSYTRCIYFNGNLATSSVYACDYEMSWSLRGEDSTCPETVDILNEVAAANSAIEPCESQNCIFWKTSWGNQTKTTSL